MTRRAVDYVRRWPGVSLSVLMSVVYLSVPVPAQDFASGAFRAHLASSGVVLWNNMWFGGHPLPAYGFLSAQLAGLLGVRVLAVLSTVVAVWSFAVLVENTRSHWVGSARLASTVFAVCVGINMWAGRLTFAPSIALGVLCLLALHSNKRALSVVLAFACSLSSPVGAVFLLIVLVALWWSRWQQPVVFLCGVATSVPLLLLVVVFSEGGWFPFRWQSMTMVSIAIALVLSVARRHEVVRRASLLYAGVVLASFFVPTPLGGNVVRLGWIAACPIALLFVPRTHRVVSIAIVVFAVSWNGVYLPVDRSWNVASARSDFFEPVSRFMASQQGVHRLEVVSTNTRREADILARTIPLARGWQTQVDRDLNSIFYGEGLSTETYREWLNDNSVSYVAVPRTHVHKDARDEAVVARSMVDDLLVVVDDPDWTIYEVVSPRPLASNGVTVTSVSPETIRLRADRLGQSVVRFRYSPFYSVTKGKACVSADAAGWMRVDVRSTGEVELSARISFDAVVRSLFDRVPQCD